MGSERPRGGGRQRVLGGREAGSRGDRSDLSMGQSGSTAAGEVLMGRQLLYCIQSLSKSTEASRGRRTRYGAGWKRLKRATSVAHRDM